MVALPTFSENWPHRVIVANEHDWADAYEWLLNRADVREAHGQALYTSFSNKDWGFKEKALAMEFKLIWG